MLEGTNKQGLLAELKAISYLINNGYWIYIGFSGKEPCDIIAQKDLNVIRVQVKSCTQRSRYDTGWEVKLSRTRGKGERELPFDKSAQDLVIIHLPIIDKLVVLDSKLITQITQITILDNYKME